METFKDAGQITIEEIRDEYGTIIGCDFTSDKDIDGIVVISDIMFHSTLNILNLPNTERIDDKTIRLGSLIIQKVRSMPLDSLTYYKVISNG